MPKHEIEALQEAHRMVTSAWAQQQSGTLIDQKLNSIRKYLQLRLDILFMLIDKTGN